VIVTKHIVISIWLTIRLLLSFECNVWVSI